MIELISATRLSGEEFWNKSALGQSLRRMSREDRLLPFVMYENRIGLPDIYNSRITAPDGHDIVMFLHDDIWLDDYFLVDRVLEGLRHYDVIGIAGNRRRVSAQPSWAYLNLQGTWDEDANLSGSIAAGLNPFGTINYFGPAPAECELLDGVLLATRKSTLLSRGVKFDRQFDFHFYDLDFCRSARQAGLRLGTWSIALTHQSPGDFSSANWRAKYTQYLDKWKD